MGPLVSRELLGCEQAEKEPLVVPPESRWQNIKRQGRANHTQGPGQRPRGLQGRGCPSSKTKHPLHPLLPRARAARSLLSSERHDRGQLSQKAAAMIGSKDVY